MKRCLFLGMLLLWGAACTHSPKELPDHVSFLWLVQGHGAQAWLFGTMHVSDPRVTTLPIEVEKAFQQCDAVYTEIEATPTMAAELSQAGHLEQGKSLADILPSNLYLRLNRYLTARGFPRGSFDDFKPWMASLQLGQIDAIPFMRQGEALDVQLMNRARKEGKRYGAIETLSEQLETLTTGSESDQIHMLDVGLAKLEREQGAPVSGFQHMLELYLSGDGDALWAYAMAETDLSDPIQAKAWNALLLQRNQRMAMRIHQQLLAHPQQKALFAFGSLHFLGPESVVEKLKSLGYEVSRVPHIARTASTNFQ